MSDAPTMQDQIKPITDQGQALASLYVANQILQTTIETVRADNALMWARGMIDAAKFSESYYDSNFSKEYRIAGEAIGKGIRHLASVAAMSRKLKMVET